MELRDWLNNGLAVAILVIVGYVLWRIARWSTPLIERLINSHMALIETLKEQAPKQTEAMNRIAEVSEEQNTHLIKITTTQEQLVKEQRRAVEVESNCVDQVAAVHTELQKQTGKMDIAAVSLDVHRKALEVVLKTTLAPKSES